MYAHESRVERPRALVPLLGRPGILDVSPDDPPALRDAKVKQREAHGRKGLAVATLVLVGLGAVAVDFSGHAAGDHASLALSVMATFAMLVYAIVYARSWRELARSAELVEAAWELRKERVREGLRDEMTGTEVASDDPLAPVAARVRALLKGDEGPLELVDRVMAKRATLRLELGSLEEALSMEHTLSEETEGSDRRRGRLLEAAASRQALMLSMSELLRDLHVELTLATDEGPDSALVRAGDLLRGLEAEREVVSIERRGRAGLLRAG